MSILISEQEKESSPVESVCAERALISSSKEQKQFQASEGLTTAEATLYMRLKARALKILKTT